MSRSGYSDDCGGWDLICWRGAVTSAINGKRGQSFLLELRDSLDAMPSKRLVSDALEADGEFCAIGVIGAKRGVDMSSLDANDREAVAVAFGIAPAMAAEIVFMNDEGHWYPETPEQRWIRMRDWVAKNIRSNAQ
ncbi:hypothetical protein [Pseudomonas typographi]|uniref:Uncharacterized protein n=1 Tax=Pseudomonas typographi TaxID=2715964 RepID=A0ABR7ZAH6_9PSED|nr:hypothetical protein [Pseudomonas typographi]MBD1589500.1 hypothetical protein [Pseudomonas typographi]MBD1602417.1 hypothetical protein [Pseudomonas typographi]